ncbi:MAG: CoA transferase, partial [Deltaproteobacteria bacterium]
MYRILDLTDEKGQLCGRMLADLGLDVIKIENPGGDDCRNYGPFYKDIHEPEKSLFWFFYNMNKRGITLDITKSEGQVLLKRLVEKADAVIESFSPGYLGGLGLDYDSLTRVNPQIIMTSITPYGQNGPYKNRKLSDLVANAVGGYAYITGPSDRAPVRISGVDQSYCHAGSHAAVGTLIALIHRNRFGSGQQVDVSIQESVVWTLMYVQQY